MSAKLIAPSILAADFGNLPEAAQHIYVKINGYHRRNDN